MSRALLFTLTKASSILGRLDTCYAPTGDQNDTKDAIIYFVCRMVVGWNEWGARAIYERGKDEPEWTALLLGVDRMANERMRRGVQMQPELERIVSIP